MTRVSAVLVLLGFLVASAGSGAAQDFSGAELMVVVTGGDGERPLQGARVSLPGSGLGGVTDARGLLRLTRLARGARAVEVRFLGYAPAARTVQLAAGQMTRIDVRLTQQPVALAELRVRAPSGAGIRRLGALGFFRRRARSPGAFVTRSEIERRDPHRLSAMLRSIPGLRFSPTPVGDARLSMGRASMGKRLCPVQYFVDGVQTFGFNIDDVGPRSVDGLEIYRGASEIPPEYNRGTAMCGVIVIWTRID